MTTTGNARQCEHTRPDGTRCQSAPMHGSRFCFWHDPAKAAERATARSKGGKARHGRAIRHIPGEDGDIALQTAGDILGLLEREINAVLRLEPGHRRARTIGYLAGIGLRALETSELAARIEALEAATFGPPGGVHEYPE